MKPKDALLAATILAGAMAILMVVDVVATPAVREGMAVVGRAVLGSDAVRILLVFAGLLSLGAIVVVAYGTAAQRRSEWEAEQARKRAIREEQVRAALTDDLETPHDKGRPAA